MKSMKSPKPSVKPSSRKSSETFTAEERAAMRERAKESKGVARRGSNAGSADGERDLLAKIAAMTGSDRALAERVHAIAKANAPMLEMRTWYGMPAYARDGKVVFFFQASQKFKTRYSTLGFTDRARLDEGSMWSTGFALKSLTAADEARIAALVKKAVS
jgi:hypothetical protein